MNEKVSRELSPSASFALDFPHFFARRGTTIVTSGDVEVVERESGYVRAIIPYDYAYTSNAQQWSDAAKIMRALSSAEQVPVTDPGIPQNQGAA